jgi:hypothetical protein
MVLMNKGDKITIMDVGKNMVVFLPQLNNSVPLTIKHDMFLILVFTTSTTIASAHAPIRILI